MFDNVWENLSLKDYFGYCCVRERGCVSNSLLFNFGFERREKRKRKIN